MTLHKLVANGLYEFKRRRIHAVTQTGRLRAIIEHVPKMRTAPGARDLVCRLLLEKKNRTDRVSSNRFPKTRPSSSRIVFCIRAEQWIAASRAKVNSLFVRMPIGIGERQFRSSSSKYVILAARQDVFPFIIRELHFLI